MTGNSYDVIVIGGGYAGVTVANRLPRDASVLLIDPKPDFVHRIRLHEFAAGGNPRIRIPFVRMLKEHVEHRLGTTVRVEPGLVRLAGGEEVRGRHILLATGSDQAGSDTFTSLDSATAMRERIVQATAGEDIAVYGAGLTGIEFATELAYRRPDLVVYLKGHAPVGSDLPVRAHDHLRTTLKRMDVHLDCAPATPHLGIEATGLLVSPLAHDSGFETNEAGRMRVARTLEAAPGVWGAGDAVVVDDLPHLRMSCAAAIPMGVHAAANIARSMRGEAAIPFDFGYSYRCISLGRRNGLILNVDALDEPTGKFYGGLRAAMFKSLVCTMVVRTTVSSGGRFDPGGR